MKLIDKDHIIRRSAIFALMAVSLLNLYNYSMTYIRENSYEIRNVFVDEDKVVEEYKTVERNGKKYVEKLYKDSEEAQKKRNEHEAEKIRYKDLPTKFTWGIFMANMAQQYVATLILYLMCFFILYKVRAKVIKKVTLLITSSLVWIILYCLLMMPLMYHVNVVDMDTLVTIRTVIAVIVLASSLLNFYITKDHEAVLENERLQTLYLSTQYESLKSKLDPHFLFNALNTLSSLIAINSPRTNEYIQKLSTIFRNVLSHEDVTTLDAELRFASAYGDLMTIRYVETLRIKYDIPETMKERKVISYGVQSLIENAIKHNTITKKLPMEISIKAENGYVVVNNPIHPRHETEESSGLGLMMLSERCMALIGRDIIIENKNNTFTVKIPTA